MQKLKNRSVCPPDPVYFRYVHSEDGFSSTAQTYQAWQQTIADHCQRNGLAPVSMEVAEDQLCNTLPAGWCEGCQENRPHVDLRFNFRDVFDWLAAHVRLIKTGLVSQDEAERRAKICSGCYLNINSQGCTGCADIATLFTSELAKRSTKSDAFLRNCGACRCYLKSLVHFPNDALSHDDSLQSVLPDFCWQKIGGENYVA